MNWVKCLISFLGLLLLAQAALAADIQRFTDSQGTLHITNMGPKKGQSPVQPSQDAISPSVSSTEKSPPSAPEPALTAINPPAEPHVASTAPGAAESLYGVQVCRPDDPPGVIHTTPLLKEEEQPGRAAGALKQVSWTPFQTAEKNSSEIIFYKDHKKIIHITNIQPGKALPEVQVKGAPAVQKQEVPKTLEPAAFQRISWQSAEMTRPHGRPPPNPDPAPGPGVNTIRRYRDSSGVWHNTNEFAPEAGPLPVLAAATADVRTFPAQAQPPPVAPVLSISAVRKQALPPQMARLAVKKVSCSELGPEVAAYIEAKLCAASLDSSGQTIRRFRDNCGVWHIANEPAPDAAPRLALAAAAAGVSPAQTHAPPVLKPVGLQTGQGVAEGQPLAQRPTVLTKRDSRGVLHIVTSAGAEGPLARSDPASFLNRVPPSLQGIIVEAAQMNGLPVTLVLAIIRNESNFAPLAVSPKGAMGLMQLMPGTAVSLGVEDPFAPRQNVLAGCRYFRWLLDSFQGSVPLALAAYNAGHQRVISSGGKIPAIKETQNFVTQVMGLYHVLEKQAASL